MTPCERLSEQMPTVAYGAADWSADEARHLAECAECRAEWALVRRVARVGRDTVSIDEEALTAAVLGRLAAAAATPPAFPRRRGLVMALAAAASIVLLVWSQVRPGAEVVPVVAVQDSTMPNDSLLAHMPPSSVPVETAELELSLPELEGLDADELETMLHEVDRPLKVEELPNSPSWGDLERRTWERGFSTSEG